LWSATSWRVFASALLQRAQVNIASSSTCHRSCRHRFVPYHAFHGAAFAALVAPSTVNDASLGGNADSRAGSLVSLPT
jgi:hypothetical protein